MAEDSDLVRLSPSLAGVAGEYYVAAELTARGFITSITLRNTRGVDILCSTADASRTAGIQVKTGSGTGRSWMLNKKAEDYFADSLFYVFVNLNYRQKTPDYFIVPSKTVAAYVKQSHADWLAAAGRNGAPHKDTTMRQFFDKKSRYLARWDLLMLGEPK